MDRRRGLESFKSEPLNPQAHNLPQYHLTIPAKWLETISLSGWSQHPWSAKREKLQQFVYCRSITSHYVPDLVWMSMEAGNLMTWWALVDLTVGKTNVFPWAKTIFRTGLKPLAWLENTSIQLGKQVLFPMRVVGFYWFSPVVDLASHFHPEGQWQLPTSLRSGWGRPWQISICRPCSGDSLRLDSLRTPRSRCEQRLMKNMVRSRNGNEKRCFTLLHIEV